MNQLKKCRPKLKQSKPTVKFAKYSSTATIRLKHTDEESTQRAREWQVRMLTLIDVMFARRHSQIQKTFVDTLEKIHAKNLKLAKKRPSWGNTRCG